MVDVPRTFGAIFVGGVVAFILSGLVSAQAFSYFRSYPNDKRFLKFLIAGVWYAINPWALPVWIQPKYSTALDSNRFLDFCHTMFVAFTLWDHLIEHFGDVSRIDYIPWPLAGTIALTGILTILVHIFFVHRIFKLSDDSYFVAVPLGILSCFRLSFAILTTVKMIQLHSISHFAQLWRWSFSLGLSLCSALDIIFATLLCYYLGRSQKPNSSMNDIITKLMLYAFETGLLNCAASVLTLVCWLTMPNNLIFLGIHFAISKLYANSIMAILNARKSLRQPGYRTRFSQSQANHPIMYPESFSLSKDTNSVRIFVDQTKVSTTA